MRIFSCPACGNIVYFDDQSCTHCHSPLAYSRAERAIVCLEAGAYVDADRHRWRLCRNFHIGCNWLYYDEPGTDDYCYACDLTRTSPDSGDQAHHGYIVDTSHAKRWLVFQLDELGLPIVSHRQQPDGGLAFDLAASTDDQKVMIGHLNGVITIDLTEASDSHRENLRMLLGEPYRTMLGHFRHEIGHYFWQTLVSDSEQLAPFRVVFGDERQDYGAALTSHYGGPRADWSSNFISQYATTHPWEDFAETFAHYLHITDTLQSAGAYGLGMTGPADDAFTPEIVASLAAHPGVDFPAEASMADILAQWFPLSAALNIVNKSMGKGELYPFAIAQPVAEKLAFIHSLVRHARREARAF